MTCIFLDVLKYIGCVGALLRTALECDRGIICVTLKSDPERNEPDSLHAVLRFLLPSSFTTLESPRRALPFSRASLNLNIRVALVGLWRCGLVALKFPHREGKSKRGAGILNR